MSKPGMIETLKDAARLLDSLPYPEYRNMAKRLRKIAAYHRPNPLGGPAKVFDTMADRIRAGEKYDDVLADCGFREVSK